MSPCAHAQKSTTTENDATATVTQTLSTDVSGTPGLTTFLESTAHTEVVAGTSPHVDRQIANPFPVQQPLEFFNRNFLVASFNWVPGLTTQVIKFPDCLLAIPTIANVMKRFRYLRAAVKAEIKIQSTPWHQGALMIGWLPNARSTYVPNVYTLSGMNPVEISASTAETVTLTIPYLNPNDWLDCVSGAPTAGTDCRIAALYIAQINNLVVTSPNLGTTLPVSVFASFVDPESTGYVSQAKVVNKEAASKDKNGMDAKGAISTVSKVIRKLPVIGGAYGAAADFVNSIAGDLEKPNSQAAPQPVLATIRRGGNQANSENFSDELSLYANPLIAQSSMMYGMETSHMTVNALAQKPMLYDNVQLSNSVTPTYSVLCAPMTLGVVAGTSDYFCAVAKAFEWYRGGIKYLFHFVTPAFYSYRVRFSLNFIPPGGPLNNAGDLINKVVNIQGDTWETVYVPYLRPKTWMQVYSDGNTNAPTLKVELLTTIVGSSAPSTPIVYLNVYRAAAEDIQFAQLKGGSGRGTSHADDEDLLFEQECDIGQKFKEPFKSLIDGTTPSQEKNNTMADIVQTVNDCVKRDSQFDPVNFYSFPTDFHTDKTQYNYLYNWEPFQYFSAFFAFWRGGRKLSKVYETSAYCPEHQGDNYYTYGDSVSFWPSAATNLYMQPSLIIPWYSGLPYYPVAQLLANGSSSIMYPTNGGQPADLQLVTQSSGETSPNVISGADDFVLLHVVPFFLADYVPSPETTRSSSAFTKTRMTSKTNLPKSSRKSANPSVPMGINKDS